MKEEQIVYEYQGKFYVNLTNRCSNSCLFCVRQGETFRDYALWIPKEPDAKEIIAALEGRITEIERAGQLVFCGFGEPLYRLDVMCEVADFAHAHGIKTRVNTNGQAGLIPGSENAAQRLKGKLDKVNVSLNASDGKKYQALCRSIYGEQAYEALLSFAKACKEQGIDVVFSVVETIGAKEVAACQRRADELGIPLRVRTYDP